VQNCKRKLVDIFRIGFYTCLYEEQTRAAGKFPGHTACFSETAKLHSRQKGWISMNLGNSLFHARKKCGLSQEDVAEKLGVSRQTISKWETGETLPDIRQSKQMSILYHVSLDDLIEFDMDVKEIQDIIDRTSEETEKKIDWTKAWGKKYPILVRYQKEVNTPNYVVYVNGVFDTIRLSPKPFDFAPNNLILIRTF